MKTLCPLLAAALLGSAPAASLYAEIDLGKPDDIAIDQPRVAVGFTPPDDEGTLIGPGGFFGNTFLFDTGSNGILVARGAHVPAGGDPLDALLNGPIKDTYATALRGDGSPVVYNEIGVGGVQALDILAAYDLVYAGTNGGGLLDDVFGLTGGTAPTDLDFSEHRLDSQRALRGFDLDFGSFGGIVGTPGMVDKITTIDLTTMSPLGLISVGIQDPAAPASASASSSAAATDGYTITLERLTAAPEAGQTDPTDPLPTFADLPLIPDIELGREGQAASGRFLLDTGAQLSMITRDTAEALGIDLSEGSADVLDFLPVGGVGPEVLIPLVAIDRFAFSVQDGLGNDEVLAYSDTAPESAGIIVGVLDVEGLPVAGIAGMNLFTAGYLEGLLAGLEGSTDDIDGLFDRLILDFTEEDWTLELIPNLDAEPFATGSTLAEADDDVTTALTMAMALGDDPSFETDGLRDLIQSLFGLLGGGLSLADDPRWAWSAFAVPEPASGLVVLMAVPLLGRRRR